jgi:hypothetical protein
MRRSIVAILAVGSIIAGCDALDVPPFAPVAEFERGQPNGRDCPAVCWRVIIRV